MAITLGKLLSEKRESRYLSLPEAELATHIKADYLRALEEERFESLPSPSYVEIYLREYARYLDLEPGALVKMYDDRMRWPRMRKRIAEQWGQFWRKGAVLPIVLSIVILALVAGLITLLALSARQPPQPPTPTPAPTATPLPKHLVVVYPSDQAIVMGDRVTLVGQVPAGAYLMVNEQRVTVPTDGYFSYEAALEFGENAFELKSWDETGWQETVTRTIVRPTPTPVPTVQPAVRQPPAEHQIILNQIDVARYPAVVAYFSVFDAAGDPWQNLTMENLAVVEDNEPVADFYLSTVPVSEPLAIALVVDVSGSMDGEPLNQAIAALRTFVASLGPNDTAALISFGSSVTMLQRFTTDKAAISDTIGTLAAQGNTALNDAVLYAVNQVAAQPVGRRAVIVMTDGKDTASQDTLEAAVARAGLLNIPVYAVGLQSTDFDAAPLEQLAQETGALYLLAPQADALRDLYAQLGRQFQGQYKVVYTATGDREEHRVTLTTRINGLVRQSSKSYRVP
jgi:VWFA-related protein